MLTRIRRIKNRTCLCRQTGKTNLDIKVKIITRKLEKFDS
jgi:hypothetical protein